MSWCYHYVQFIRAVAKSCPSSADRSEDLYLSMDTWILYNAERKKKKKQALGWMHVGIYIYVPVCVFGKCLSAFYHFINI